jgi:hypothetical protein
MFSQCCQTRVKKEPEGDGIFSTSAMKMKDQWIESLVISHEIGYHHTLREMLFAVPPL